MERALRIGLLIELKNPKNLFSLLLVVIATIGSMFFIHSQMLGDQIYEQTSDYYTVQSALTKFQVVDASEDGDGSPLYKNLHAQKRTVALQLAALKMEKDRLYFSTSLKLATLREQAMELDDYDKIADLMPSKVELQMQQAYFNHMKMTDNPISNNNLQYWPYLAFLFSIIGAGWYVLISFYTSNILLEDYEHSSIVKGYPIAFHTYMLSKCVTAFTYICLFIFVIFICALPLIWIYGTGNISYPIVVYLGKAVIMPTWQFILLCIFFMLVVSIFAMVLSIILNVWLKNMYLTLFVQLICFFLPTVFPKLISLIPINPFHFTNFNQILNGVPLSLPKAVNISMLHGTVILIVAIVIMIYVIKRFFSIGKIGRV